MTDMEIPKIVIEKVDDEIELPNLLAIEKDSLNHNRTSSSPDLAYHSQRPSVCSSRVFEKTSINRQPVFTWQFFLTLLLPVILSPLLFVQDSEHVDGTNSSTNHSDTKFKCAYVVILMVVSWMLQLMPIGITSLLPFVLFPVLGILDAEQVSRNFVKETTVLFVAGIIIALAVEYCNLHRRIALRVMGCVGCSPSRLTLGTMLTTAFLSMWINNTATAGMAIPIVSATVDEIFPPLKRRNSMKRKKSVFRVSSDLDLCEMEKQNSLVSFYIGTENEDSKKVNLKKMLFLSICLAANIGGTGVITGSASNLIFQEQMKSVHVGQNGKYMDVTFATWMLYNIPPVIVNLLICWLYLVTYFNGVPSWLCWWKKQTDEQIEKESEEKAREKEIEEVLMEKYNDLGSMTFHECAVLLLFVITILLWLFRHPGFTAGWEPYLPTAQESTVGVFIIFLFFIIPRGRNSPQQGNNIPGATLLDWKYVQDSLPWGVVLLLGGGFAMSDGIVESGLSQWLRLKLVGLHNFTDVVILFVLMFFTVGCTSVASNSATANTVLALLIPLSRSLDIHPLYLTLPTTVACSYAFLLPISTPPNALVYQAAGGDLTIGEMVKVMAFPNVICVVVLFLFHISYGNLIFHFNDYVYESGSLSANFSGIGVI